MERQVQRIGGVCGKDEGGRGSGVKQLRQSFGSSSLPGSPQGTGLPRHDRDYCSVATELVHRAINGLWFWKVVAALSK